MNQISYTETLLDFVFEIVYDLPPITYKVE